MSRRQNCRRIEVKNNIIRREVTHIFAFQFLYSCKDNRSNVNKRRYHEPDFGTDLYFNVDVAIIKQGFITVVHNVVVV